MSRYVIVGAGTIGCDVATRLAEDGHEVVVASRRGLGPTDRRVVRAALDATDATALSRLSRGADALFNCANPPYHRWATDWPPLAESLLTAAELSGATLVTLSNLYGYGSVDGPLTPDLPLDAAFLKGRVRARMWRDQLAAHRAGRVRAVEVRASDFIGCADNTVFGGRVVPRIARGRAVSVLGDPGAPHSWTYVGDVSETLIAVARDERAWGRAWHVATNEPRSQRQVVDELAELAGRPHVAVRAVARPVLWTAGLFSPTLRELRETLYQFESPFVIDDTETRSVLGLHPTEWREVLTATLATGGLAPAMLSRPRRPASAPRGSFGSSAG